MGESIRHPVFARVYERFVGPSLDSAGIQKHRARLLAGLSGDVVEVGAGNGLNFAHYPAGVERVVAVEPEPTLRASATRAAASASVPIEVVEGRAERLPFEDASFDGAVACLVLCSVRDQGVALAELRRVLRPGGVLRFFEHVQGDSAAMRRFQRVADATFWPRVAGGCHSSRDTASAIRDVGFEVTEIERFVFPPTRIPSFTGMHVLGSAVR